LWLLIAVFVVCVLRVLFVVVCCSCFVCLFDYVLLFFYVCMCVYVCVSLISFVLCI